MWIQNNYYYQFTPRAAHRLPHQYVDKSRQIYRHSRYCMIYNSLRRRVGPVQTRMLDVRNTCFSGWMCTNMQLLHNLSQRWVRNYYGGPMLTGPNIVRKNG